jgi:hypothetical protein
MFVCVYSMFVLSYVQIVVLPRADLSTMRSTECTKDHETEKAAKTQQRAVEPHVHRYKVYIMG